MHDMVHGHEWGGDMMDITQRCPNCRSTRVEPRNYAQRLGGAIGAIAGSTSGIALALTGMEIGLLGGPVGAMLGGMAGVVIEGIEAVPPAARRAPSWEPRSTEISFTTNSAATAATRLAIGRKPQRFSLFFPTQHIAQGPVIRALGIYASSPFSQQRSPSRCSVVSCIDVI
jgi:hypothetical protein